MIQLYSCNIDAEKYVIMTDICVLNSFRTICPLNLPALVISPIVFVSVDVHRGLMMVRYLFFKVLLTYEDAKGMRKNSTLFHKGYKAERFKLY